MVHPSSRARHQQCCWSGEDPRAESSNTAVNEAEHSSAPKVHGLNPEHSSGAASAADRAKPGPDPASAGQISLMCPAGSSKGGSPIQHDAACATAPEALSLLSLQASSAEGILAFSSWTVIFTSSAGILVLSDFTSMMPGKHSACQM